MNKHKSDLDSNKHYQLPVGLLAQLEEPCRGHGFNSCTGLIFFQLYFHYAVLITAKITLTFVYKWLSYIHSHSFVTSQVYYKPTKWPAPSWPISSVGRALHWYCRGPRFNSHTGLIFFQALFSLLLNKWCSLMQRWRSPSFNKIHDIKRCNFSLDFFETKKFMDSNKKDT